MALIKRHVDLEVLEVLEDMDSQEVLAAELTLGRLHLRASLLCHRKDKERAAERSESVT